MHAWSRPSPQRSSAAAGAAAALRRAARLALAFLALIGGPGRAADDPPAPPARPRPIAPAAIILEPPADLDALLAKLRRPDLMIGAAAAAGRWLDAARPVAEGGPAPPGGVVGSVRVEVRVGAAEPLARVVVALGVYLDADGAVSVPIALDGLVLGRVAEGARDLPVRPAAAGERGGWAVELAGRGEHRVEVEAVVPVRPEGAGRGLGLAIPPAGITAVEVVADRPLAAVEAGPDEPLVLDQPGPPGGARATGHLGPRARLDLAWRPAEPTEAPGPPLLGARGEVAVTVDLDGLETRETWSIGAIRGTARAVTFRLRADEEVVDLAVAGRPVVAPDRRPAADGATAELVVPLAVPLGGGGAPGSTSRPVVITLATRRHRPADSPGDSTRFALGGHPIGDARSQAGVLAVARREGLAVVASPGRGVRRADPGADLPDSTRGGPESPMGFEFADQPFDLALQVEAVAPRFEVRARSAVTLGGGRAEVRTTLTGRVWRGILTEARVLAPAGLAFRPAEPGPGEAAARSARPWPPAGPPPAGETLTLEFGRPIGAGGTFAASLRGSFAAGDDLRAIPLFQPLDAAAVTSEVALVAPPDRQFEPTSGPSSRFARLDPVGPPAGWAWPGGDEPAAGMTPTWLRAEGAESTLPGRLVLRPRLVRHRATLTLAVDRAGADAVVELAGDVANGTIAELEVALPPEVPDRWTAESSGTGLDREPLGVDPSTGWRRYRLRLPAPVDLFQVWLRYRLDFPPPASGGPGSPPRLGVQPIRCDAGTADGPVVRLAGWDDVEFAVSAPGWTDRSVGPPRPAESGQEVRRVLEHAGDRAPAAIEVAARFGTLADLPTLVASRLWLRSTKLPGGALATSARYRLEAHGRAVTLRLPPGSRWVRGVAGTVELTPADVERVAADTYRIALPPAAGPGPIPLRVDSVLDEEPADGSWPAPGLVDGVVQQTAWELSLLGTRAGIGVPAGWSDENAWRREGVLWRRRPRRDAADLARWLLGGVAPAGTGGGPAPARGAAIGAEVDWAGDLDAGGRHSYLFGRAGPPGMLVFPTWSRTTLFLICSGPVLLVGLLVLGRQLPPRRVAAATLVLVFGCAAMIEPNTGLLVAESSSVGAALAGIAGLIHLALDRRGRLATPAEPSLILIEPDWADPSRVAAGSPSAAAAASAQRASDRTEIRPASRATAPADGGSTGEFPVPLGGDIATTGGLDLARAPEFDPGAGEGR